MANTEKARVFMNGRSQAVRIPAEYRFSVKEVYIRRNPENGELVLSEHPLKRPLAEIFAQIDAAGGAADMAHDLLLDRDRRQPEEREWM